MAEFTLRPKAHSDLAEIWDFTFRTWGRDQARLYLRTLNRAFKSLAGSPERGRRFDELHEGLRVYPSGKHLIFYLPSETGIDIVRVLHNRMDIPRHVP